MMPTWWPWGHKADTLTTPSVHAHATPVQRALHLPPPIRTTTSPLATTTDVGTFTASLTTATDPCFGHPLCTTVDLADNPIMLAPEPTPVSTALPAPAPLEFRSTPSKPSAGVRQQLQRMTIPAVPEVTSELRSEGQVIRDLPAAVGNSTDIDNTPQVPTGVVVDEITAPAPLPTIAAPAPLPISAATSSASRNAPLPIQRSTPTTFTQSRPTPPPSPAATPPAERAFIPADRALPTTDRAPIPAERALPTVDRAPTPTDRAQITIQRALTPVHRAQPTIERALPTVHLAENATTRAGVAPEPFTFGTINDDKGTINRNSGTINGDRSTLEGDKGTVGGRGSRASVQRAHVAARRSLPIADHPDDSTTSTSKSVVQRTEFGTLDAEKSPVGGNYGTVSGSKSPVGGNRGPVGGSKSTVGGGEGAGAGADNTPGAAPAVQRTASDVDSAPVSAPIYLPSWARPAVQPSAVAVQRAVSSPGRQGAVGRPISRTTGDSVGSTSNSEHTLQRSLLASLPSNPVPLAEMFSPVRQSLPNVPDVPNAAEMVDGLTDRAGKAVAAASDVPASAISAARSPAQSAPAATAAPGPDLEELARQLYEPLTARLRAELWLDRERSGLLTER